MLVTSLKNLSKLLSINHFEDNNKFLEVYKYKSNCLLNLLTSSFEKVFAGMQGRGGLISKIEKLKELGISPKNKIDEKYISEKEVEIT